MQHRAFYMKTYVRFIVIGDSISPQKNCCATLNIFTKLTVTCSLATLTECIVVFSLQQWLRERATRLRYTYIAHLLYFRVLH
jgi:hypothetical protein